jgi:hypothetical protein
MITSCWICAQRSEVMLQQEGRDASCRWVCLPVCTASDSQHSSTSRFSPDDVFTSLLSGSSSQLRAERRGRLLPTACLRVLCCRGAALRVAVRVVTNHTGGFDRVLDQHACLPGASEETSLTHCLPVCQQHNLLYTPEGCVSRVQSDDWAGAGLQRQISPAGTLADSRLLS